MSTLCSLHALRGGLTVRSKYQRLRGVMDERVTRLWAATEAEALGYGGIATVVQATGISKSRVRAGLRDLAEQALHPPTGPARAQRIRRPGAGRPALVEADPRLVSDLESLVDPVTRGDPESPLRWTCKSKDKLAAALREMGHKVSATLVGRLLHQLDYSLQVVRKTREGKQSPDRNAQFEHINRTAKAFMKRGQPVVSVDTKKKELVGDFKNAGREWQRKGEPEPVRVHDFIDELGKVIPYGVYDTARNEAWVSVGVDHDTAEFAVATLERWWREMGKKAYPKATELLVTADGGGSNAPRSRLWRVELQRFADITGLIVSVCHFPPGTRKSGRPARSPQPAPHGSGRARLRHPALRITGSLLERGTVARCAASEAGIASSARACVPNSLARVAIGD